MTNYIPANRKGFSTLPASQLTKNPGFIGPAKFRGTIVESAYRGTSTNGQNYYDVAFKQNDVHVSYFRTQPRGYVGMKYGTTYGLSGTVENRPVELSVDPNGYIVGLLVL